MIRVLVVEDQTLVREGLCTLLRLVPDIEVADQAGDGEAALEAIAAARPDVVLLDLRMPRLDGLGVLRALHQRGDPVPVLVLTTFDDDEALLEAVRHGARGYLLKDVSLEQLAEAVRTVAAGGELIHPSLSMRLVRTLAGRPSSFDALDLPDRLTRREQTVLRLAAAGCGNDEIADALGLATGTVKNHISTILSKLGVRDRTRAVLRAYELGLL